ncbi:MAG: hypothetical protein JSR83_02310 [Proteobacteria bacterium]|nr:hypothetical protein [Pseudomonadota bacterium]
MTDLLFRHALAHDTDLVFGAAGSPSGIDAHVSIAAAFPAISAQAQVAVAYGVQIAAILPIPTASVTVKYRSETSRPVVGTAADAIQVATRAQGVAVERVQLGSTVSALADVCWQEAAQLGQAVAAAWSESMRARSTCAVRFQRAVPVTRAVGSAFQDAVHRRVALGSQFEEAQRAASRIRTMFQDAYRDRRLTLHSGFEDGRRALTSISCRSRPAIFRRSGTDSRFQNARKPPPGIWLAPTVPIPGHYVPQSGDAVHLLFRETLRHHVNLVFGRLGNVPAREQIVIPVLRCYIVTNSASLTRVSNNLPLPVFNLSIAIDSDDPLGIWSWSASMPLRALADLESDGTDPVVLEAVINGAAWRLIVAVKEENESFDSGSLAVRGYGLAVTISDPMFPSLSLNNASDARTAQQLAESALSFNGVPIGWSLDWQIDDWLVPAGAWVFNGTPLEAVKRIASAAGAYVQAAPSEKVLRVLYRYPVAPWDWASATPEVVLPASAVLVRGTGHVQRADYNAVYVSGQANGKLARVKRAGTAGDTYATMIVDPLISSAAPARGRGLEVLGNTGAQRLFSLETGVLPSSGVIHVGTLMDFTRDSAAHRGLVRQLSVTASVPTGTSRDPIKVRQSIKVETHG